ncbi:MAG: prolipoprotein diacylglyceryl transferase [Acidobacteriota bacterium]
MLPEVFRVPGLDIPILTYGLLLTIAFMGALWITTRLAANDGIPKNRVYDLAVYTIPSALLGTKLLMTFTAWQWIVGDWDRLFSLDLLHSVGHYLGGFLAALLVSAVLARVWRVSWLRLADPVAPGLALGNVIGRVGCFAAGCCWGTPTDSWVGVRFTERAHKISGIPINVALLPTQLFEAGANLMIFVLLLWLWKKRAFYGQVILSYIMLYSVERFVMEFWRADPRGQIMNVSSSQFISLCMFPIALLAYGWYRSTNVGKASASVIGQWAITRR